MYNSSRQPEDELTALWLPTGQAARTLGCSIDTLKRYATRDEFLIEGKHWRRGAYPNSPRVWNIPACRESIRWQGRLGQRAPKNPAQEQIQRLGSP